MCAPGIDSEAHATRGLGTITKNKNTLPELARDIHRNANGTKSRVFANLGHRSTNGVFAGDNQMHT